MVTRTNPRPPGDLMAPPPDRTATWLGALLAVTIIGALAACLCLMAYVVTGHR